MPRKGCARIGALFDDRAVAAFDPNPIWGEDPPVIGFIAKPLKDGPRCRSVHRSRRPVVTRKTLDLQQAAGEVERHIDRANGAPAVEAAMCCDNGTKKIGHDSLLFQSRVRCTGEVQRHGGHASRNISACTTKSSGTWNNAPWPASG